MIQFDEEEEEPETSSNTIPTASPINAWEHWVAKKDDSQDETNDSSEGSKSEAVEKKEEEEEIESYWASWESGGGWNVRGRNTSTRYEYSLPIKVVLWTVVLFVI